MVLPQPAAHDARAQAVGWVDELALSLGLSDGGAIALVDRAHPARLGDLVRTLLHTWPELEVLADVRELDRLAPGSAVVLAPRAEDADWLNQRRQLFTERRLKVVLWCDEATTIALKRGAVDLWDWIAHRQTCPPGPPPFAVRGLLAAFEAGWPVVWPGDTLELVEEVVRAAAPTTPDVAWIDGAEPYERLLERLADGSVVAIVVPSAWELRRARWAIAESRRSSRVIVRASRLDCPGFWPVRARFEGLAVAKKVLADAGARAPLRLAALLDLEPEAIGHASELLRGGTSERDIAAAVVEGMDPTAGLSRLLEAKGRVGIAERIWLKGDPLILRNFMGRKKVREAFDAWMRKDNWASDPLGFWAAHGSSRDLSLDWGVEDLRRTCALEPVLRAGGGDVVSWFVLATAAASFGEHEVASHWLSRIDAYLLPPLLRRLLRAARDEREPLKSLALRHAAADVLLDRSDHLAHSALFQFGLAGASLLGGGFIYWLALPTWQSRLGAVALALAFVVRGLRSWRLAYLMSKKSTDESSCRTSGLLFLRGEKEREDKVLSALQNATARLADDDRNGAESCALDAVELVERELSEEHPLYAETAKVLGSVLLANDRGREALELMTALLSLGREISDDLALLTARVLAGAGRAGDAVRVLGQLTGAVSTNGALLPSATGTSPQGDPMLDRLLDRPRGTLAKSRDAHLALIDALLKQGRYPEALLTARKAVKRFARDSSPAVQQLRARVADLERRMGPAA